MLLIQHILPAGIDYVSAEAEAVHDCAVMRGVN